MYLYYILTVKKLQVNTEIRLKPIPLAVLALTACKYLINKLEEKEII